MLRDGLAFQRGIVDDVPQKLAVVEVDAGDGRGAHTPGKSPFPLSGNVDAHDEVGVRQGLCKNEGDVAGLAEDSERDVARGEMGLPQRRPFHNLARNAAAYSKVLQIVVRPPRLIAIRVREKRENEVWLGLLEPSDRSLQFQSCGLAHNLPRGKFYGEPQITQVCLKPRPELRQIGGAERVEHTDSDRTVAGELIRPPV